MMRDFAKSMFSFSWAMSVFGLQQVTNLVMNQDKATKDFDEVTQAVGGKLGQTPLSVFLLGDSVQREALAASFRLLSPAALSRNSAAVQDLINQSVETVRYLNPLQDGDLTLQEIRNKITVFRLVLQIPDRLKLPDEPPYPELTQIIEDAYDMEDYPALWAVEGVGHWYGSTYYDRGEVPHGILKDDRLNRLPEKSFTMLNAGIGMAIAQHWIKQVNHLSPVADIRHVLGEITTLCRDNATPGFEGAALESLGLITQNGQFYDDARPDEMVQIVGRELQEIGDQEAFEYFWHGVGRAHYFLPINFLPGYGSIWHAWEMIREATEHNETAWLNAIAGLAWGATMVNIRHPKIIANVVKHHGNDLAIDDGFANGVASSLMMRADTTPGASFISEYYEYEPDASDADLVENWNSQVRHLSERALTEGGYYDELKQHNRLGEIFRYHYSFPDFLAHL